MDEIVTQPSSSSKSKPGGYGCIFFFCLIFLISGAIPALLDIPGVQARFSGRETTVFITSDRSCSWEDSNNNTTIGYYYTYTFTVSSGKVYRISDTSCSRKSDALNVYETIWYQPDDPTHFITSNTWNFYWLFLLGFSLPMLLFVYFSVRKLLRRLFASSRRFTEIQRG